MRQKVHVPAYASFAGASPADMHNLCQVLDISETGLALQCPSRLEVDQSLGLLLNLAEAGGRISATARVVWSDSAGRAGFHLSAPDDSTLLRLREWLLLNALAAAANAEPPTPTKKSSSTLRQNYTDMLSAASAVQREAESLGSDLEAVLVLVASRSQSLLRSSGAAIALAPKVGPERSPGDSTTMICRASSGESAPPVGATLQVGSGFSGECVRTGKLLRCDDTETDGRVDRESCRTLGIRSLLAAPIRAGEKSIGLLEVFSAQPRAYTESDSAVLQRFAETILAAVNRALRVHAAPPVPPKPFSPPPGSILFAYPPDEPTKSTAADREKDKDRDRDKNRDRDKDRDTEKDKDKKLAATNADNVGGIRLPRSHLILLVAAAATIFLALGFLTAPWIQPWVQEKVQQKLHTRASSVEQTVLASSHPPADAPGAPPLNLSADSANLSQLRDLAAHGDPAAENALGLLYSTGDDKQGVRRDEYEAARWFTKAAEHGSIPAQSKLGSLYSQGRGLAKDDNQAYFWTVLARANGDDASKVLAPFIASRLTLHQRTTVEQQAEQWLQQHESHAQSQPPR
jgi:GAF domain-containing protein